MRVCEMIALSVLVYQFLNYFVDFHQHWYEYWTRQAVHFNPLVPELVFLTLAHPVYEM